MRSIVFVLVVLSAPAGADPFVSSGVSISYGSRGLALGVEISAGIPLIDEPAYVGTAVGFDVAPASETWGRFYVEVETGALIAGAGLGPSWLFGGPEAGRHLQFTPYLTGGHLGCEDREPFVIVAPFYRYTSQDRRGGLHEGGTFVKLLSFVNGRRDNGFCVH